MNKPRILFLCDRKGWAYDLTAQHLANLLKEDFYFDIKYVIEQPIINQNDYDLIYVFWWGERYHRKFISNNSKVVKEISSHRWEFEEQYGYNAPGEALRRYMCDADYLVATSQRLFNSFADKFPNVYHYSLGVDSSFFKPKAVRSGPLKLGWAGNINDRIKGVTDILMPAVGNEFELLKAPGDLSFEQMNNFYNLLDVICIASTAEGTPLPLIEAMGCGCFPVTTNVGVVPELIENGRNGLIVEANPQSFSNAFVWCRDHLDYVRKTGQENAKLIHRERTWQVSAQQFSRILNIILREISTRENSSKAEETVDINKAYDKHFERINPTGFSDKAYYSACQYYKEDVEALLPDDKDVKILEIGTGHGHFLRYLTDEGYMRVIGIDLNKELIDGVRIHLADCVERLEVADAKDYLGRFSEEFDYIVMLDMIEHVTESGALDILTLAHKALKPKGRLILRTPNMANILGGYSLYMDSTHRHGYTEWSLLHALEQAGFQHPQLYIPQVFTTRKRALHAWLNRSIHKFLYHINDRATPKWFGKNIVVWADR